MSDELYVPYLIDEQVVHFIMKAKEKMPVGWKIRTDERIAEETGWGFIVLIIDSDEFEKFSLTDRIRIAEVTNALCIVIQEEAGIRCVIEKN